MWGRTTGKKSNKVEAGGNYGWRCLRGARTNSTPIVAMRIPTICMDPIVEYGHDAGFSVTGGYVYHGSAIPDLRAATCSAIYGGRIWNIAADTEPTVEVDEGDSFDSGLQIASFAQDADGELYIVDHSGTLHRLEAE